MERLGSVAVVLNLCAAETPATANLIGSFFLSFRMPTRFQPALKLMSAFRGVFLEQ